MKIMNYLIVGGNSTIGKVLISSLVQQGHTCYVISRSDVTPSHPSVKSLRINILEETIHIFPYSLTLEGQYIIKNLAVISAGIVLGATVRGGKLVVTS